MLKVAKLLAGIVATGAIARADDSPAQKTPAPIVSIQAQASQPCPVVSAPTPVASVASDDAMKWTGFYFGANSGYIFGQQNLSNDATATANIGALGAPQGLQALLELGNGLFSSNKTGYIGGGQIGYNYRFEDSPLLIGAEADFMGVNLQRTVSSSQTVPIPAFPLNSFRGEFNATQKLRSFGSVRGRVGALWGDKLLTYGTVGYAYGDSTLEANRSVTILGLNGVNPQTTTSSASARRTLQGHVEGFGVEYALNQRWSVKAEILHYDLGSQSVVTQTLFNVGPSPFVGTQVTSTVKVNGFINVFGINYHY